MGPRVSVPPQSLCSAGTLVEADNEHEACHAWSSVPCGKQGQRARGAGTESGQQWAEREVAAGQQRQCDQDWLHVGLLGKDITPSITCIQKPHTRHITCAAAPLRGQS